MVNQYEINPYFWAEKTVSIIGGTGSMGQAMAKELCKTEISNIRIISRDEYKHYRMKEEFAKINGGDKCHFIIADMRDKEDIIMATKKSDIIFSVGAMKDVKTCEVAPTEAKKTNVIGNENICYASIANDVEKMIFVSTDKAYNPTTYYGKTKQMAEALVFKFNIIKGQSRTKFGVTRCGNLFKSRRSIVETFDRMYSEDNNCELPVHDDRMTRFFISIERAARFQLQCAERLVSGDRLSEPFIPDIYSCRIIDLIKGRYPKAKIKIVGAIKNEKLHEGFNDEYTSDNPKYLKGYPEILEYL